MEKKIILLILIVFVLVTGCSVTTLDSADYSHNVDAILSTEKGKAYNTYFEGYKYYLPKELKFLEKEEYNSILLDRHGNRFYLYVDAISFYYKEKSNYDIDKNAYFSKKLDYNNIDGYLQIDEIDGKYLIQYMYNYAKIETYVDKDEINDSIVSMSYLLRSIKFNRKIIASFLSNELSYQDEEYNLFDDSSEHESFLDVVYKNEDKAYKEAVDEEKIKLTDE